MPSGDVNAAAETIRHVLAETTMGSYPRSQAFTALAALVAEVESLRAKADKNAAMWERACDEAERLRAERDAALGQVNHLAKLNDGYEALRVEKQQLEERVKWLEGEEQGWRDGLLRQTQRLNDSRVREQRLQEALLPLVAAAEREFAGEDMLEHGITEEMVRIARGALAADPPPQEEA